VTPTGPAPWGVALRDAVHPPVGSRRFWVVQLLAIGIGTLHAAGSSLGLLRPVGLPGSTTLVLFLLPVVYAALNFGLTGSIATAAWVTVLSLPVLLLVDAPSVRWLDASQLAGLDVVGLVVGLGTERERTARRAAEQAGEAHRAAEARYRALFGSNVAPILVADRGGRVLEANRAASQLFDRDPVGRRLEELIPAAGRDRVSPSEVVTLRGADGRIRRLRPIEIPVGAASGGLRQLVLQDVTDEERARGRVAAYAAGVVRAQEEERRRIAVELHDDLLQAVIELSRRLEAAAAVPALSPPPVPSLVEAAQLATQITHGLRRVARGLRPPLLDDLGLEPAVRALVADAESTAGLAGRLEVVGLDRRPPSAVEVAAFRIAQEAVRNVERHARASRLVLRLAGRAGCLHLVVADDGIGFPVPPSAGELGGLGLVGMQERVRAQDGRLRVSSRPGRGTLVAVSLPLGPAPAPDGG